MRESSHQCELSSSCLNAFLFIAIWAGCCCCCFRLRIGMHVSRTTFTLYKFRDTCALNTYAHRSRAAAHFAFAIFVHTFNAIHIARTAHIRLSMCHPSLIHSATMHIIIVPSLRKDLFIRSSVVVFFFFLLHIISWQDYTVIFMLRRRKERNNKFCMGNNLF